MRISIFGAGYVGAVTAGCLARDGHRVVVVDTNPTKVDTINRKQCPVAEPGLQELIAAAVERGALSATMSAAEAVDLTNVSLVCVGTPSNPNGSPNLEHVETVCRQIGQAIREKSARHSVVVRSTVVPGTMRGLVIPTLEANSRRSAGVDFGVGFCPEFLREGTAIRDYYEPAKTVIGEYDTSTGDLLNDLYEQLSGTRFRTSLEVAEMVKFVDNCWHALKVAFANEIGAVCKPSGIDSHDVMDIFCADRKLNISSSYLTPGFAFGGSCLPKDLRALTHYAKKLEVEVPVLSAILPSNRVQIDRGKRAITSLNRQRIGILGIAFKAGTDDLRESPAVDVVEALLDEGYEVRVYDNCVRLSAMTGSNKEFIDRHLPHISCLLTRTIEEVLDWAEVVVVCNTSEEFRDIALRLRDNQTILEFHSATRLREH